MVWVDSYPDGTVIQAKTLHTVLQNMKVLIRERAICNNSAKDEHSWTGSTADGTHPPSEVGWCKTHATYADFTSFTPKVPGSLHWVTALSELYSLDSSGTPVKLSTVEHGGLVGLSDDDHTQYYKKDETRPMTSNATLNSTGALTQTAPKSNAGTAMASSHASQNWATAHPTPNPALVQRHLGSTSIRNALIKKHYVGESHSYYVPPDTAMSAFMGRNLSGYGGAFTYEWDSGQNVYRLSGTDSYDLVYSYGYIEAVSP